MVSRSKRKSALSSKSKAEHTNPRASDGTKAQNSENFGLLTASESSDGALEFAGDIMVQDLFDNTDDESALFDFVQIQIDRQLQNELDSYIRQEQGLDGQFDEAYSPVRQNLHQTRTSSSRSSIFDLPKDAAVVLKKSRKKNKIQEGEVGAVQPIKQKKKKRKVKSTNHYQD